MEPREFALTYKAMLDDAAAIIHNQEVLANVHSQLDRNLLNPLEQDFVYQEHFGSFPSEPKSFIHQGIRITTRILHQTGLGLRDIQGADLLYEIESQKFGLIQYKRASDGTVKNDKEQLQSLLRNCPDICTNQQKRLRGEKLYLPLKTFGFCGYWFHIISDGEERNVTACEAETIFQGQATKSFQAFRKGLSKEAFVELFASCRIGALVNSREIKVRETWVARLIEARHLILNIVQHGFWRSQDRENDERGEKR